MASTSHESHPFLDYFDSHLSEFNYKYILDGTHDCSGFVKKITKAVLGKSYDGNAAGFASGANFTDGLWYEVSECDKRAGDVFAYKQSGIGSNGNRYSGHCGFVSSSNVKLDCTSKDGSLPNGGNTNSGPGYRGCQWTVTRGTYRFWRCSAVPMGLYIKSFT